MCPVLVTESHQLVATAGSGLHGPDSPRTAQPPPAVTATVCDCPASLQDQPLWASGLPLSPQCAEEGSFKGWAAVFTHGILTQGLV